MSFAKENEKDDLLPNQLSSQRHPDHDDVMRLFMAAMSLRPERKPTGFLAACVYFSPGG